MFSKQKPGKQLFRQAFLKREQPAVGRRRVGGEHTFPWGALFLWTIFLVVGAYMLFVSPVLSIGEIAVEGESVISADEYRGVIDEEIRRKVFAVLRLDTFFLIPEKKIERALLLRYPKLEEAKLSRHFPSTLRLSIAERPAILLWCTGGPCYALREGKARMLESTFESRYAPSLSTVTDQSAVPVEEGASLPVEAYLSALDFFISELPDVLKTGIEHQATTPSRHSGELKMKTLAGWELFLSVERSFQETLNTLELFLVEYDAKHSNRNLLRNIDLRVEGKVFYSNGNGVVETLTETAKEEKPDEKKETKKPKKKDS